MSIRNIAVQYVGPVMRMPIVVDGEILDSLVRDSYGNPVLERKVTRIEVTQPDGTKQMFVPEEQTVITQS